MYIYIYMYTYIISDIASACNAWIECLIFTSHFAQKSPIISGSFAENDIYIYI